MLSNKLSSLIFIMTVLLIVSMGSKGVFAETNLILNFDLESNTITSTSPDNFTASYYGTSSLVFTYPVSGHLGASDKAAKISITNYTDGDAKWVPKPIPVTAGDQYLFTDLYNSDVTTQIAGVFCTDATCSNNASTTYGGWADIGATAPDRWNTTNVILTAPEGATYMTVFHAIYKVGNLSVDNFSLTKLPPLVPFTQGFVSLALDDGWKSQYDNAFPILTNSGYKATFYLISNALLSAPAIVSNEGPTDTYFNVGEALALQNAGHEIGAHTKDHCDLVLLLENPSSAMVNACASVISSPQNANEQVTESHSALIGAGLSTIDTFAYPYGMFNSVVEELLRNAGFVAGRAVTTGTNNKSTNIYGLRTRMVSKALIDNPNGLSIVKSWIDDAVANKTWLIITFHEIQTIENINANMAVDPASVNDAISDVFFEAIINYLKEKEVCVETIRGGVNVMKSVNNPCPNGNVPPLPTPTPPPPTPTPSPSPTPTPTPTISGDINGDGKIDRLDLTMMMNNWGKVLAGNTADLNQDRKVNALDFVIFMRIWNQ